MNRYSPWWTSARAISRSKPAATPETHNLLLHLGNWRGNQGRGKIESPMDPDQQVQPRSMIRLLWQHARQSSARIPTKGWIAAGTVLVVGLLLILHASISKDATLRFRLQHTFHSAQVSLWIDGDLTYSGKVMGAPRKRFGVIPDGSMVGTVSQVIPVSSGRHRIKVRVEPDDGNVQEAVIGGEFQS